jgi:hypothetical protein
MPRSEMGRHVQVLEVSSREVDVRNNLDLSVADLGDLHNIAEVTDAAVDLDLVLEELLEGGDVEDLVACGLRSVDDELGFISFHFTADSFPNPSSIFRN